MTYTQLKQKEVVNTCDGAKLGNVCDLDLSPDGRILALIVPGVFSLSGMFKGGGETIPWDAGARMGYWSPSPRRQGGEAERTAEAGEEDGRRNARSSFIFIE